MSPGMMRDSTRAATSQGRARVFVAVQRPRDDGQFARVRDARDRGTLQSNRRSIERLGGRADNSWISRVLRSTSNPWRRSVEILEARVHPRVIAELVPSCSARMPMSRCFSRWRPITKNVARARSCERVEDRGRDLRVRPVVERECDLRPIARPVRNRRVEHARGGPEDAVGHHQGTQRRRPSRAAWRPAAPTSRGRRRRPRAGLCRRGRGSRRNSSIGRGRPQPSTPSMDHREVRLLSRLAAGTLYPLQTRRVR